MGWRDLVANVQNTSARTFPEPVLYTPEGLTEIAINGIFREPHVATDLSNAVEVSSEQPTLDVVLADLPQDPSSKPNSLGDRVVISRLSSRYRVIDVQPDGEGMAKLFLHLEPVG